MDKEIKCYSCGYTTNEESDMPDLFYTDSSNSAELDEQYALLLELQQLGYNIVTCGNCGSVIITKQVLDNK